jgi:peptidoglycan/xylan/chitin deacetylase (PgdA/CDA1 family)
MGLTKNNFKVEGKTPDQIKAEQEKPKLIIETSWDDGFSLDLKVAEYLKKYGFGGVFYVIVDMVGKDGRLTWDQIKELEKMGFEIGSHTVTHPADLKALYDDELHFEIQNSKDMIEAVLGHSISKFCYPRGRADDRVKRFVAEAGYVQARGTGAPGKREIIDKFYIPGTIHIFDRAEYGDKSVTEYAKRVIDAGIKEGGYINIWGHSQEIEDNKLWNALDEILAYAEKAIRS